MSFQLAIRHHGANPHHKPAEEVLGPHLRGTEAQGVKEPVPGLHSGKQSQVTHVLALFTLPHCLPGDSTSLFYGDRRV